MIAEPLSKRLGQLITAIMHEERDFHTRVRQMKLDQRHIDCTHTQFAHSQCLSDNHLRLRSAHEAMFKVHRKIAREHDRIMAHCRTIAEKLSRGRFSDSDMAREMDKLETVLRAMKAEHQVMEIERRRILAEHDEIVRSESLDSNNSC